MMGKVYAGPAPRNERENAESNMRFGPVYAGPKVDNSRDSRPIMGLVYAGPQTMGESNGEAARITCSKCQAKVPANSKFCNMCGILLSIPVAPKRSGDVIECSTCGNMVPSDRKFCDNCGCAIKKNLPTYPDNKADI